MVIDIDNIYTVSVDSWNYEGCKTIQIFKRRLHFLQSGSAIVAYYMTYYIY